MTASRICPICDGHTFTTQLTAKDYTVSQETFKIDRCLTCNFLQTTPVPANIDDYYLSNEYISHSNASTTLIDKLYKKARHITLRWKSSLIKKYCSPRSHQLLDYGCGTGAFIRTMQKAGWQTAGVEPSEKARRLAIHETGSMIVSRLEDINAYSFDVITLWHVLEHVQNLNDIIPELKKKMNKSGIILIAVPNHNSYDAEKYKSSWAAYDVPRHLWHFSQSNMQQLLKRHHLVLTDILPMKLDAFYVSLLSEKYKNEGRSTPAGFLNGLMTGLRSNLRAIRTKEYSSLIFIARI